MVLEALRRGPASGQAEQLVVLLHGVGADGHDLIDLAVPWTKGVPQAAFLAPHAPEPYDGAPHGRQWFSLQDRTPGVLIAGARRAAAPLLATVDAELARLGLGPEAAAFAGFRPVVPWRRSLDAERALRGLGVPVETLWRPSLGHALDEAGLALGGLFLQRAFLGAPADLGGPR